MQREYFRLNINLPAWLQAKSACLSSEKLYQSFPFTPTFHFHPRHQHPHHPISHRQRQLPLRQCKAIANRRLLLFAHMRYGDRYGCSLTSLQNTRALQTEQTHISSHSHTDCFAERPWEIRAIVPSGEAARAYRPHDAR